MLQLGQLPVAKICQLINANLDNADKLGVKLKWGFTEDGDVFGRIVDGEGQTLYEKFYLGKHVMLEIEELHADFCEVLESLKVFRKIKQAG